MDKDLYKRTLDSIHVSDEALQKTLDSVRNGKKAKQKRVGFNYGVFGAVAACLALIIVLGAVFFPISKKGTQKQSAISEKTHIFTITANAAEIPEKIKAEQKSNIIGMFVNSSHSGYYFDGSKPVKKGDFPDHFQCFELSSLKISGKNISSVSVKSKTKGVYFNVSARSEKVRKYIDKILKNSPDEEDYNPEGFMAEYGSMSVWVNDFSEEEYKAELARERKKFSDADSLKNSQYTLDEMKNNSYTGFFSDYTCDGFTYANSDKKSEIVLDRVIELVCESNQGSDKQKEILGELYEVKSKLNELYGTETKAGYEKLEKKSARLEYRLLREIVSGAQLEITVRFDDGSEQTKSFELQPYLLDSFAPWVALTEKN